MGAVEAAREFWRGVLVEGGVTTVPRWTLDPARGIAEHESTIPDDLVDTLRDLADELTVPLVTVLLAAHAKVLAALAGAHDVATGYVATVDGRPLPCRLSTASGSWRALLLATRRVESDLLTHRHFPVVDLARELGLTESPFETVFDPGSGDAHAEGLGPVDDTALWVRISQYGGRVALRLRYRTDVLDADCAARIAGYHRTALALMAADPDAEHGRAHLLSDAELNLQLEGLAGPSRALPDLRFHEIFEQRVATHPDAVAAVLDDRSWTYRELNSRANRLGRALLARGLRREGVVAVVTERNLDWMAAVLAVFKAGGVYLPIEPHFPADRIATTLARAGCALVLTEVAATATLAPAVETLPGVEVLFIDEVYDTEHSDGDLDVRVESADLAYIYFTSGSTGEPKGAMCEHAGMLNHLFAKIDDLGIGEGDVVAQTAPQCFDISLWQLVSGLLVGGRTLLIPQDVILDVARFVDTIVDGRASVLQVVPSYLEAVMSYVEAQPRDLADLRCVSVTGEALKKELAERWFAAQPGIKLANAYGLTETSDDTNHEVMDRAPIDRVPLGRPVNNVTVYVVDEHLAPVPLGAPGEIVFSGVCVGRGYINDPDRTRAAFMADPHRAGERLYRSGDFGRWQPDGKLAFLGRRDTQVKISGFRIEIGEIENTLLRVPGVHDGAVVVTERADQSRHLVAFYSGPAALDVELVRGRLGGSLPEYMVPSAFHWQSVLPLTANGKIDKKVLRALAISLDAVPHPQDAPVTPTEQRLAAAWATVLGVGTDQIGRNDHFFDRGGTSLSAVRLVIALERVVSLKDVTRHPVLADLASLVDGRAEARSGLLQVLSESDGTSGAAALVCFPYAGGNAVNFQPMARELRGRGLTVYAVELPGHDVAAVREPFVPLAQVVDEVVAEIVKRNLTRIVLWGHSSGTAFAVATARRLQERGVEVRRVILAAQALGDAVERRAAMTELTARSDADIAASLTSGPMGADGGYTELGGLDAERAALVAAAYRHDCVSAHGYLADALEGPPPARLIAPVTVVVAADDPSTAGSAGRYLDWRLLAEHVDVHELTDGGHYFLRTRPEVAAEIALRAAGSLACSRPATT